jgi:hypothetical protein
MAGVRIMLMVFGITAIFRLSAAQTSAQSAEEMEAVPNRPTLSSTAETVQKGVFEIEYGTELAKGHQNINGLLKFGLTNSLELRFGNNPITRDNQVTGRGDSAAGFKFRFLHEKGMLPSISTLYTLTVPTATAGLGIAAAGHAAGILVSKDFGRNHLDFNECIQWVPQSGYGGFDHNYFTAIAYSHPITEKIGFSEEMAWFSRTNNTTGAWVTLLQSLEYSVSRRLILDTGFYVAAVGDIPRVTFFAGVTYAVTDLYHRGSKAHRAP